MKNVVEWKFAPREVSENILKFFLEWAPGKHIFKHFTHIGRYYYDELF